LMGAAARFEPPMVGGLGRGRGRGLGRGQGQGGAEERALLSSMRRGAGAGCVGSPRLWDEAVALATGLALHPLHQHHQHQDEGEGGEG